MRYHHLGIPVASPLPGMEHLAAHKAWASDHRDNAFGLQFMHYEADCSLPELVRTRPHLAFVVDDLDSALVDKQLLIAPNRPSEGVRVAFICERGEPVELLEFEDAANPLAGGSARAAGFCP